MAFSTPFQSICCAVAGADVRSMHATNNAAISWLERAGLSLAFIDRTSFTVFVVWLRRRVPTAACCGSTLRS